MLETGLVKGVTIKFPLNTDFTASNQHVNECSDRVRDITLNLSSGNYATTHRVKFVPYAPGGVNYAETNGEVLSGFFTGCVMTVYTYQGRRRVGHVHTGSDAGANLDCKRFMGDLLRDPMSGYREVTSFKPYDGARDSQRYMDIARTTAFGAQGCAVLGLVSATTNRCYSIFTRKIGKYEYVVEARIDNTLNQFRY